MRITALFGLVALGIVCVAGSAIAAGANARVETGKASFISDRFEGGETASGTRFDNDAMVAAHPTHPAGTRLRVTNLENGKSVEVRVVDEGPTKRNRREGVVIDLSKAAAQKLDFVEDGRTQVKVEPIAGK